jgi:hypothetical protein
VTLKNSRDVGEKGLHEVVEVHFIPARDRDIFIEVGGKSTWSKDCESIIWDPVFLVENQRVQMPRTITTDGLTTENPASSTLPSMSDLALGIRIP